MKTILLLSLVLSSVASASEVCKIYMTDTEPTAIITKVEGTCPKTFNMGLMNADVTEEELEEAAGADGFRAVDKQSLKMIKFKK